MYYRVHRSSAVKDKLMRKVTFATCLLLILATLFTTSMLAAEIITVKCICLTKQNPSECKITTQEFQHLEWDDRPSQIQILTGLRKCKY